MSTFAQLSANFSSDGLSAQRMKFLEHQLLQLTNSTGFSDDFHLEHSNSPTFGFSIFVSFPGHIVSKKLFARPQQPPKDSQQKTNFKLQILMTNRYPFDSPQIYLTEVPDNAPESLKKLAGDGRDYFDELLPSFQVKSLWLNNQNQSLSVLILLTPSFLRRLIKSQEKSVSGGVLGKYHLGQLYDLKILSKETDDSANEAMFIVQTQSERFSDQFKKQTLLLTDEFILLFDPQNTTDTQNQEDDNNNEEDDLSIERIQKLDAWCHLKSLARLRRCAENPTLYSLIFKAQEERQPWLLNIQVPGKEQQFDKFLNQITTKLHQIVQKDRGTESVSRDQKKEQEQEDERDEQEEEVNQDEVEVEQKQESQLIEPVLDNNDSFGQKDSPPVAQQEQEQQVQSNTSKAKTFTFEQAEESDEEEPGTLEPADNQQDEPETLNDNQSDEEEQIVESSEPINSAPPNDYSEEDKCVEPDQQVDQSMEKVKETTEQLESDIVQEEAEPHQDQLVQNDSAAAPEHQQQQDEDEEQDDDDVQFKTCRVDEPNDLKEKEQEIVHDQIKEEEQQEDTQEKQEELTDVQTTTISESQPEMVSTDQTEPCQVDESQASEINAEVEVEIEHNPEPSETTIPEPVEQEAELIDQTEKKEEQTQEQDKLEESKQEQEVVEVQDKEEEVEAKVEDEEQKVEEEESKKSKKNKKKNKKK